MFYNMRNTYVQTYIIEKESVSSKDPRALTRCLKILHLHLRATIVAC